MKSFLIKRKSLILRSSARIVAVVLTVAVTAIANHEAKDPLDARMSAFEKSVNQVLLDPNFDFQVSPDGNYKSGSIIGYLKYRGVMKKDRKVDYASESFQSLLVKANEYKLLIEQHAGLREKSLNEELNKRTSEILIKNKDALSVVDGLINKERSKLQEEIYGKFAGIVVRYFQIQKRLVENQIKNAHDQKNPELFKGDLLDKLNLKLNVAVGGYIAGRYEYTMFYNMWHTLNPNNQFFDLIELGLTPQDKSNIEQAVLEERKSQYAFSKLIQLLSVRERIINQWATERMSRLATSLSAPNLLACAATDSHQSGLVSVRDFSNSLNYGQGSYYDYLWKKDRFDEFFGNHISKSILDLVQPKTLFRPILSREQLESLLFGYFELLEGRATTANAAVSQSVADALAGIEDEIGIVSVKDSYKSFLDQLSPTIEENWKVKSKAALMDANLMADRWDNESVADRSSLYAYQFRRKFISQVLFFQALSINKISQDLSPEQYQPYYEKALKLTDSFLEPVKLSWLKNQKEDILSVLRSDAVKQLRLAAKDERLSAKAKSHLVYVQNGAKAMYADHKIDQLSEANTANGAWKKLGLSLYKKEYELGYMGSLNRLNDKRIHAWLPDQLTKFFFDKLKYWKESVPLSHSYLPKIAKEIEENKQVMRGMHMFFTALNNNFMKQVEEKKLEPSLLGPTQTPLYLVMKQSAVESYQQFVASIDEKPELIYAPKPQNWNMPSDHIDQSLSINKPQYDFKNSVPQNSRERTIQLFVQAMSLLNVGQFLPSSKEKDIFDTLSRKELNFSSYPDMEKYRVVRARTFLQVEALLAKDNVNAQKPSLSVQDRIFGSLLDQRILAKILQNEVTEKLPLQAIQYASTGNWLNNPDLNAETVFELAAHAYAPSTGIPLLSLESAMKKGLDRATKIIPGLIVEACSAKPMVHDDSNYQKIFKSSRALRRTYTDTNDDMRKIDEKLVEFTKTPIERKEERMTKIVGISFAVFMACIAIYFLSLAPVLLNFTSSSLFGIAEGLGSLGKVMILPFLSVKGLFSLFNVFVMTGVFAWQVALQYQVGCIELPNQLKYQLNVSNSQVNDFGKVQTARKDLEWLNTNIQSMYLNVQIGVVMQAIFVLPTVSQFKSITNSLGLKALRKLESVEPIVSQSAQTVRVTNMAAPTLSEMISAEGRMLGPIKYLRNRTKELLLDGQFRVLNAKTTFEELQKAINVRYSAIFGKTSNLEEVIKLRNDAVRLRAEKLSRILENNAAIKARLSKSSVAGSKFDWSGLFRFDEIGYHVRNFYDRYVSIANIEKRKYFKAVMNHEVLSATDDAVEVIWNPSSRTFKMSPKNPNAESFERIVVDQYTAAEVSELMKIAEMNELAKEYLVNERLIGYVQESRIQATEFVKNPQNAEAMKKLLGDGPNPFLPSLSSSDAYEQVALEMFFDEVTRSNNWNHVLPVFKWATAQGGKPSGFVLELREMMQYEAALKSELAWTKHPEAKQFEKMKSAYEKAQKAAQEAEAKKATDEASHFDEYEEVLEDAVYEFEITQDGIRIDPANGGAQ